MEGISYLSKQKIILNFIIMYDFLFLQYLNRFKQE